MASRRWMQLRRGGQGANSFLPSGQLLPPNFPDHLLMSKLCDHCNFTTGSPWARRHRQDLGVGGKEAVTKQ